MHENERPTNADYTHLFLMLARYEVLDRDQIDKVCTVAERRNIGREIIRGTLKSARSLPTNEQQSANTKK